MVDHIPESVEDKTVSVYLVRFILLLIPIFNVACCFVWAFVGKDQETRNFGKAGLIVFVFLIFIAIGFGIFGIVSLGKVFSF